ncbi:MAG TPA: hypothetical protein VFV72_09775 [Candidatus Limnocylindrales bacterium]|nr:hypothetical protein [Candidatus Limnocylindrales bacterium]
MTGFGVLLIILGLGSLLLPMFNLQFRLMEIVDPYQPFAGIIVAAIGAVLVYLGLQRTRAAATAAMAPAAPAAAPAAASAGDAATAPPATPPSGEPPVDPT